MDITALVTHARNLYVAQLEAFAEAQAQSCTKGAAEVKLRLGEQSKLFSRFYCADFISNDGKTEIKELMPDRVLSFTPVRGMFGNASVGIEHVRWDDVVIHHDAPELPPAAVAHWFELWFDANDERRDPTVVLSGRIHSLLLQPGTLSVDFGSAPSDAFWDMLGLLEKAGATAIRVSSSRAEASSVG